jgi:hypothetical protein
MKTKEYKTLFGCVAMLVFCSELALGVILEKPTANLTERYDTVSGWVGNISGTAAIPASAGWINGAMVAKLTGVEPGGAVPFQSAWIIGLTNSSDGRFSGDFSKIESIAVDVQVQNSAPLSFFFKSTTGVQWNREITGLPKNTTAGTWLTVTIPLTQDRNWWSFIDAGGTPDFVADKASVSKFGFEVRRIDDATASSEKILVVDNVRLVGPWDNRANWVDGRIPLAWLLDNKLTETDVNGDWDGDNFSNVAEFLTGTDPRDTNSFFRIEIGRNEQGKTVVKWNDNKYVQFDLFESVDLSQGFTPAVVGIMGMGTAKREMQVDDTVSGPHFFKVEVRPAQ